MLLVMQSKTNCIHPSKWVDPTEADGLERLLVLLETEQNRTHKLQNHLHLLSARIITPGQCYTNYYATTKVRSW